MKFICPICHGRHIVECSHCKGSGRLKVGQSVERRLRKEILANIIYDYDVNPDIYGDNKFEQMSALVSMYKEKTANREQARMLKFKCSLYQREMLEVKFKYKGNEHYCHIDVRAGRCIFDKNF